MQPLTRGIPSSKTVVFGLTFSIGKTVASSQALTDTAAASLLEAASSAVDAHQRNSSNILVSRTRQGRPSRRSEAQAYENVLPSCEIGLPLRRPEGPYRLYSCWSALEWTASVVMRRIELALEHLSQSIHRGCRRGECGLSSVESRPA